MTVEIKDLEMRIDDAFVNNSTTGNVESRLSSLTILLSKGKTSVVTLLHDNQYEFNFESSCISTSTSNKWDFLLEDFVKLTITRIKSTIKSVQVRNGHDN